MACSKPPETNWAFTLDRNGKEPYGCFIAYNQLHSIFPGAEIKPGRKIMQQINRTLRNDANTPRTGNIILYVAHSFEADSMELEKFNEFIQEGNAICIISNTFSENILDFFRVKEDTLRMGIDSVFGYRDTLRDQIISINFNHEKKDFLFNGLTLYQWFDTLSPQHEETFQFGYVGVAEHPNVLAYVKDNGALMIGRSPVAFTNYFLLQGDNRKYYEYFLSFFNEYPSTVTWYSKVFREAGEEDEENDLSFLLKFPPLFYAFLMILALLLLYTVFASKRKQKEIPIIPPNLNSSLEFVETVGGLYFSKKDNANLAEKMIRHYLENVRTRYNIPAREANEELAVQLALRAELALDDTRAFVSYLNYIRSADVVTDIDIQHLYRQLQKFS